MTALQPRWHHQQPACTTAASRVLLGPVPWPSQQAHHAQACLVSRSNSHSHSSHRLTSHRWRSATCCRAKSAAAAAAGAATSSSNHPLSLQGLLQLEPQMGFLAQTLCHGVLLPVLAGWLFVAVLSAVASRARQVGESAGVGCCISVLLVSPCDELCVSDSCCWPAAHCSVPEIATALNSYRHTSRRQQQATGSTAAACHKG